MKIVISQFNAVVGDIEGNAAKIISEAKIAHASGAHVMLTPELALCGYIPEDLLLRPAFMDACHSALEHICRALADLKGFYLVLGYSTGYSKSTPTVAMQHRYNAAAVLHEGELLGNYYKHFLPNYQVFDEDRYFKAGDNPFVFEAHGVRMGVLICEDIWFDAAALQSVEAGAQVLLVLNASPFHSGKQVQREKRVSALAAQVNAPVIYANLVGGQDELVFDGGSFAVNEQGKVVARAKQFDCEPLLIDMNASRQISGLMHDIADENAALWQALVLGVKDYFGKNGFKDAVLGLSGGVDSALVLAIAVDALGAQHLRAVMMPSAYTADISLQDAREMAHRLNVDYDEIAIEDSYTALMQGLGALFRGYDEDVTEENLQARIRGTLLMAISNKTGALVLATGNKSELATGYCTLYGDMAGGFAVIKDVLKTRVYNLAYWRNVHDPFGRGHSPIPQRILTRAPSAELRPEQKDQDSLPAYAILDEIIQRYVEKDQRIDQIVNAGFDAGIVEKVVQLIKTAEYKRRQAPIGVRVTPRAFGKDWRYPITSRFKE